MILLEFTKTHNHRYIYILDELIPLIKDCMSSNTYLFTDDENKHQLSANALRCFFKHTKERAEVEVLSPHKLRHYYANQMYKKSFDIKRKSSGLFFGLSLQTPLYIRRNGIFGFYKLF